MKDTNTLKITTKIYGNKSRMLILFQLFVVPKAPPPPPPLDTLLICPN